MKRSTRKMTLISVFSSLCLSVTLTACTPAKSIKQSVYVQPSKQVSFGKISTNKIANGIKVSGQVRKKSLASRRIKIAGHIHVLSKSATGEVLETVTARTHRLYKRGTTWHFDGVLTKGLPVGSVVVVKYHGRY